MNEITSLSKSIHNYYDSIFPYDLIVDLFFKEDRTYSLQSKKGFWIVKNGSKDEEDLKSSLLNENKEFVTIHLNNFAKTRYDPEEHKGGGIIHKEFVIDADMNDINDKIRTCCKGEQKICMKCWNLCILSMKITNYFLTRIFGYKKVFFFFSGRRGYQVIVFDKKTYSLNQVERANILSFIQYCKKNAYYIDEIWGLFGNDLCSIIIKELQLKQFEAINNDKERSRKIMESLWPVYDSKVTTNLTHNSKCPYSLHSSTFSPMYWLDIESNLEYPLSDLLNNTEFIKNNINLFREKWISIL